MKTSLLILIDGVHRVCLQASRETCKGAVFICSFSLCNLNAGYIVPSLVFSETLGVGIVILCVTHRGN